MHPFCKYLAIFLFTIPFNSLAIQFDWSGYLRGDLYSIKSLNSVKTDNWTLPIFGHYMDVGLDTQALISDGLKFKSKFTFFEKNRSALYTSQRKGGISTAELNSISLQITHLYFSYEDEFFKVSAGRIPFGFGLGMTYSKGSHPIDPVFDTRDGVSFETRWGAISINPYLMLRGSGWIEGALQMTYEKEAYKVAALYNTTLLGQAPAEGAITTLPTTLNVYGEYKLALVSLEAEIGAYRSASQFTSYAAVANASWNKPLFAGVNLSIMGGYASKDKSTTKNVDESYTMNVNLDTSFLLGENLANLKKRSGSFKNAIFIAPGLTKFISKFNTDLQVYYTLIMDSDFQEGIQGQELIVQGEFKMRELTWINRLAFTLTGTSTELSALTRILLEF